MTEKFEQRETENVEEIQFNALQAGDTIILGTRTGSIYRLTVTEGESQEKIVALDRNSDHPVKQGDLPLKLDQEILYGLRGSCRGVLQSVHDGSELSPVNPTEGCFTVGEQAWLSQRDGLEAHPFITSTVQTIEIVKAENIAA